MLYEARTIIEVVFIVWARVVEMRNVLAIRIFNKVIVIFVSNTDIIFRNVVIFVIFGVYFIIVYFFLFDCYFIIVYKIIMFGFYTFFF